MRMLKLMAAMLCIFVQMNGSPQFHRNVETTPVQRLRRASSLASLSPSHSVASTSHHAHTSAVDISPLVEAKTPATRIRPRSAPGSSISLDADPGSARGSLRLMSTPPSSGASSSRGRPTAPRTSPSPGLNIFSLWGSSFEDCLDAAAGVLGGTSLFNSPENSPEVSAFRSGSEDLDPLDVCSLLYSNPAAQDATTTDADAPSAPLPSPVTTPNADATTIVLDGVAAALDQVNSEAATTNATSDEAEKAVDVSLDAATGLGANQPGEEAAPSIEADSMVQPVDKSVLAPFRLPSSSQSATPDEAGDEPCAASTHKPPTTVCSPSTKGKFGCLSCTRLLASLFCDDCNMYTEIVWTSMPQCLLQSLTPTDRVVHCTCYTPCSH